MSAELPRKTVIVTGGASGIGLGIVNHFGTPFPSQQSSTPQEQTYHIAILDIHPTPPETLLPSLTRTHPTATFSYHKCDVSSWDDTAAAFRAVYLQQGRVDIVMANAGISREESLIPESLPTPEVEPRKPALRTLDVNFTGALYCVKLGIHYLLLNEPEALAGGAVQTRGTIIITSSNAGVYPFPVAPLYAASKAGLVNLTRSLALPLAPHHIQINALAPAVLETNIAPSKDLFKGMLLTPMATLQRAVKEFIADPARTGQVVEVHGDHVTVREPYEIVDEDSKKNLDHFWGLGYA